MKKRYIFGAVLVFGAGYLISQMDCRAPWTVDRSPEAVQERIDNNDRVIRDKDGNVIGIRGEDD